MAKNEDKKQKLGETKPQTDKKIVDTFDDNKPLGKETPDNFSKYPTKHKEDIEEAEKLKNKESK